MPATRKKGKSRGKPPADPAAEARLGDLEKLLEKHGVPVRYDSRLDGRGGLCRVRGEPRVILNGTLPTAEKVCAILEALEDVGVEVPEPPTVPGGEPA